MANKPLRYRPAAVPTPLGWAHEMTGEQLTSHRNLEPAEGTEDYQPNNRKWMAAYNEGPADVAPAISRRSRDHRYDRAWRYPDRDRWHMDGNT